MYQVEERITTETITEPAERETRTKYMYDHSRDGAEPVRIGLPGS